MFSYSESWVRIILFALSSGNVGTLFQIASGSIALTFQDPGLGASIRESREVFFMTRTDPIIAKVKTDMVSPKAHVGPYLTNQGM